MRRGLPSRPFRVALALGPAMAAVLATSAIGCSPPDAKYDLAWACAPGGISEIADDFDDGKRAEPWVVYSDMDTLAKALEVDSELRIDFKGGTKPAAAGYEWHDRPRSLLDCSASVEVPSVASADLLTTYFIVNDIDAKAGGKETTIAHAGSQLFFRISDEGHPTVDHAIDYDAAAHRFWRIREAGGTTYFETSRDGREWAPQFSSATPTYANHATINLGLSAPKQSNPTTFGAGTAVFDNLNVVP